MKKDEFFAQLRTAFAGMDEELLTDILGDYENHFKEGIENGKSEEEICEELGNVEEIRQAFLDENPAAIFHLITFFAHYQPINCCREIKPFFL
jgi:uncharacterized membrane protein